jgi:HEXXH motif-containing protein
MGTLSDPHVLAGADFDALAEGAGRTRGALRGGQLSKRMLLLRAITDTAAEQVPDVYDRGRLDEVVALLDTVQRGDRATAEEVLLSPHVGAWAAHCLRRLRGIVTADAPIDDDLGYLGGIAAAAALRAGVDFQLTVRAARHGVIFPTLGLARVPGGPQWLRARRRPGVAGVELDGAGPVPALNIPVLDTDVSDSDTWIPLRRLTSVADDLRITLILDDLDPHRDQQGLPVAERLAPADVAAWQTRLDEAWALLVRDHRARAEAIAPGVAALVPLVATEAAPELSATSSDAFGAVALTHPTDGLAMAGALVHEFQHAKLSALLDLVPLHGRSNRDLFYAPWRADPRPLRGLLQGAYAYLGLSDFWHAHRIARGDRGDRADRGARLAQFEFARWREQVWGTLSTLEGSGDLTADGVRFVEGMRRRLAALRRAEVPQRPAALAQVASSDHRTTWRLRNLQPDPGVVADWADAWLAGRACPATGLPPTAVVPSQRAFHSTGRTRLAYLWVTDPPRFDRLLQDPARLAAAAPPATVADALLLAGDVPAAARAYRDEIAHDPNRVSAWTGLVLAHRERVGGTGPLAMTPEAVLTLHREIVRRSGSAPDPVPLAGWLAGALTGGA